MTTVVKDKMPIAVPPAVQRRAGIVPGDHVKITASRGVITIVSKPDSADEYSAEQRRAINSEIAKAQRGPYHGPFKNGKELARYLKDFPAARKVPGKARVR